MKDHYNIAVIGGGPAGIMAAGTAAASGAKVLLIEKNDILCKKLLLTGKGRCNITHAETDIAAFIQVFGPNGKFLYPGLQAFSIEDTLSFFNQQGLATKIERGQRVFPVSDSAADVRNVLVHYLKRNGAEILLNRAIKKIIHTNKHISKICHSRGEITAEKYIICTGGLSYPATGSSGDGYQWARELGHTIVKPQPSLTPVIVRESWISQLAGLSLRNVRISLFQDNRKQDERFGEALYTHHGLSGPVILDMSKKIGELLLKDTVKLIIDFKPALDHQKCNERLLRDFQQNKNKAFKNSLDQLLPKKLIPIIIQLSGIDPQKQVNSITREERKKLVQLLKEFSLTVKALSGFEKAIITAGGTALNEIDPRNMRSRIMDNLYFAGEILDLDGPTGGYNLQVCWSTGYLAGQSAAS